ncbi:MAG TPA: DUF6036 family nucleotidyltransferase [Planctomycetota bacterium]
MRYVLIGGMAVIYHGYPRLTGDVDVIYDCALDNVERLWAALVEFWAGSVPGLSTAAELCDPNVVVQFGRPPNRVDLIASLRTVTFEEAWRNRVQEQILVKGEQIPVSIVGLGELRRSKREAGRPKDLDDLEHLPK